MIPSALLPRVLTVTADDLQWPFRDTRPEVPIPPLGGEGYAAPISVDPFPCYAHSADLVADCAMKIEEKFPMGFEPRYFLLSHEDVARTNGQANRITLYNGSGYGPDPYEPYIVLSGKRIPPHPAMTRYLVAHEYGHLVQWWIERKRGIKDAHPSTVFDREYAILRGVDLNTGYGGGRWHANIGELIANDFRILVGGVEPEFWPHPGFEYPTNVPQLQEFWNEMVALCGMRSPALVPSLCPKSE